MNCNCSIFRNLHEGARNGDAFSCPEHGTFVFWERTGEWLPEIPLDWVGPELTLEGLRAIASAQG